MRVLLIGNKNRAVVSLESIIDRNDEVVGVVAPPNDQIGDWYPSLPSAAAEYNIPVYQPKNVNEPPFVDTVRDLDPELVVLAGYNQILQPELIDLPSEGILNLHGGKLPEYRGSSTLNWMIIEGETVGGVSIIFIDEGIDTGDIVRQETFDIGINDTIVDIIERTDELFGEMLTEVLAEIESGTVNRTPQQRETGRYYHTRKPRDGKIDWTRMTARDVHNLVRCLVDPYPGAFTTYEGQKLIIWETSLLDEEIRGVPGRVCLRRGDGVVVIAADRGVLVETVQPEGGNPQAASTFFDESGCDLG